MFRQQKLGYLVFEARQPHKWQDFFRKMLGLPEPLQNSDGSAGYRVDDAAQRLIVTPGSADDLGAIGLELPDDAAFDSLVARFQAAGLQVLEGDEAQRHARRVKRLVATTDPAGNRLEAYLAWPASEPPFTLEHFPGGFVTGALGLGHIGLAHPDLAAMESFYVDVLGFAVSDRLVSHAGPLTIRGTFLHANRRHHSVALFDMPSRTRLHHFMLQSRELEAVGRAFERAEGLGVPLSLGLGQHRDPGGTFSFYGATPSGFDFEIGAGSQEIDPLSWRETQVEQSSWWGHTPTVRLKLRTLGALVVRSLGGG